MAARRAHNPKAVGSSPTPAKTETKGIRMGPFCFYNHFTGGRTRSGIGGANTWSVNRQDVDLVYEAGWEGIGMMPMTEQESYPC